MNHPVHHHHRMSPPTTLPVNRLAAHHSISHAVGLRLMLWLIGLLLLAIPARAQWEFGPGNGGVTIIRYTGPGGAVSIPDTLNSLPVTGIASRAFAGCADVTSLAIPQSVAVIEILAFPGCINLSAFTVAPGNTKFSSSEDGVLFDKGKTILLQFPPGKTGSYVIPGSVFAIADAAFGHSKVSSVTIPTSVFLILEGAFDFSTGLTEIEVEPGNFSYASRDGVLFDGSMATLITYPMAKAGAYSIPDEVASIGDLAFLAASNVTDVFIPEGVTSIGVSAFYGCTKLAAIAVDPSNPAYASTPDGVLFNKSKSQLVVCPAAKTGAYAVPDGVTRIGNAAFAYCGKLDRITLPDGVSRIGDYAFESCRNLSQLALPEALTHIGEYAFESCTSLTRLTVSANVTALGEGAFAGCGGLASATFLGNAPTMGLGVFDNTANGFTLYFFNGATGFTTPTWQGYPSVNMGANTPIVRWLLANGTAYDAELDSDPNSDGVSLLTAYALDLDPNLNLNLSGSLPRPVLIADELVLSFPAGRTDVTYAVEASTDLQSWSAEGVSLTEPNPQNLRTATVLMKSPGCFLRLKLIVP